MGPKVIPFISKTAPNSTEIVSIYEIIFLTRDDVVIDKIGPSVYVVKHRLLTNGRSVYFDYVVCAWSLKTNSHNLMRKIQTF